MSALDSLFDFTEDGAQRIPTVVSLEAQALDRAFSEYGPTRRALADALAHLEANTVPDAERIRAWRALAGIPAHDAGQTPEERRDDGIARAAAKWTDAEVAQVDKAIRVVAASRLVVGRTALAPSHFERLSERPYLSDKLLEFTTADVWAELGPGFPVTTGIAGRMTVAKSAGIIANTGRTVIAPRDATGPNHGQRLTVWRAL